MGGGGMPDFDGGETRFGGTRSNHNVPVEAPPDISN
jgi:hypothetical protein